MRLRLGDLQHYPPDQGATLSVLLQPVPFSMRLLALLTVAFGGFLIAVLLITLEGQVTSIPSTTL
jgi:hypothetical protein